MKKKKIVLISFFLGVLFFLTFFSIKYNVDTTNVLRDIFYFPINVVIHNKKIELENRCIETNEELESLKNLLEINNTLSEFKFVTSVVVNRNASYWNNELTINKGSRDNIKKGMAVIDEKGLIGKVEKVSFTTSVVKLITNYSNDNKTSVRIISNGGIFVNKILEVDINNRLIITGIDNDYNINIGDEVITSGLSDIYPSGITIGQIEKIEDEIFGLSKKAYVKHISDLDNIRFVSVLIRG